MNGKTIVYKKNQAEKNDIYLHLRDCNNLFVPPLDLKVDIHRYTQKIYEKADTFEAWLDDRLVGLIAVYCNNLEDREAYITNVSVVKELGEKGIASELLSLCIKYVEKEKFTVITLEVNKNSTKAINLYEKYGFRK